MRSPRSAPRRSPSSRCSASTRSASGSQATCRPPGAIAARCSQPALRSRATRRIARRPLITAASYGDADVARELIAAGADLEAVAAPDAGGVPGGTALLHAAVFGMTPVLDVLVAAGARVRGIEEAAAAGDLASG